MPEELKSHRRQCFERHETRIRAVKLDGNNHFPVDAIYAVTIVLGAAPRFLSLRPELTNLKKTLDLSLIDSVVELA